MSPSPDQQAVFDYHRDRLYGLIHDGHPRHWVEFWNERNEDERIALLVVAQVIMMRPVTPERVDEADRTVAWFVFFLAGRCPCCGAPINPKVYPPDSSISMPAYRRCSRYPKCSGRVELKGGDRDG